MPDGVMDYGSGRYKITGGADDGHQFHAGESFEVYSDGRWLSAIIEFDGGLWVFRFPLSERNIPDDLIGLPVRLAQCV